MLTAFLSACGVARPPASDHDSDVAGSGLDANREDVFVEAHDSGDGGDSADAIDADAASADAAPSCRSPSAPTRRVMPPGDPSRDAVGECNLFESIVVDGITDLVRIPDGTTATTPNAGTAGVAIADFDRDGQLDLLTVHDAPGVMRLLLARGRFRYELHALQYTIIQTNRAGTTTRFDAPATGRGANIPNVADFDGDGFLDILITRGSPQNGANANGGNTLLMSQGAYDRFVDVTGDPATSARFDAVRNLGAYQRQSSIGDVDGDGHLDIALGADSIGTTRIGYPASRVLLFRPATTGRFADGRFEDVSADIPDFPRFMEVAAVPRGTVPNVPPPSNRSGPGITLRDLDDDGDLDLAQSYHMDMNLAQYFEANAVGQQQYGTYLWRNRLREDGAFRFERVTGDGFSDPGRMRYELGANSPLTSQYVTVDAAPGLPYLSFADVDNDGRLDILGVGPTDPEFHVQSDFVAGRFWKNLGALRFRDDTTSVGLDSLNWNYGRWSSFFGTTLPAITAISSLYCSETASPPLSQQLPRCAEIATTQDHQMYGAGADFGDFDNDGDLDLIVADRHEFDTAWNELRNILYLNDGRGVFAPVATSISGLDRNGVAIQSADLDRDGLLDLVVVADPENSYNNRTAATRSLPAIPSERFVSAVYWNTGATANARANHWIEARFSGLPERRLVGARVLAREPGTGLLLGRRDVFSNHAYKTGNALEVHFGLGARAAVDLRVVLADGTTVDFPSVSGDQFVDLGLVTRSVTVVRP